MTDGEADTASSLRVATWNVWWRFGPWEARARAISEALSVVAADVCTLQEVWGDERDNLALQLADRLGYQWVWAPSPRSDRWCERLGVNGVQIGHAILSRWPLRDVFHEVLPAGASPDEGRLVLGADVQTPWGQLPVITTQLNSHPAQSAVRQRQADSVAVTVSRLPKRSLPTVVTGDFNSQPSSDEVRRFEGHLTAPAVTGQVLVDAWRYASPDDPGFTWDRRNPYVAATFEPSARIDYIFVAPPAATGWGHVRAVSIFGNQPFAGVWPSDHFGVIADLNVESPQADLEGE